MVSALPLPPLACTPTCESWEEGLEAMAGGGRHDDVVEAEHLGLLPKRPPRLSRFVAEEDTEDRR